MCYNTRLKREREEIARRFEIEKHYTPDFDPTEEIIGFNHSKTPVITNINPDQISLYNWGLIPSWSLDDSIKKNTLNARIETLYERKSFKQSVQNRCLIIADGFYQWQWLTKSGSSKQKYLITKPNDELFAFAGIYSQWKDIWSGETINSYSLITTQANELMAEIHNIKKRMPVILTKENEKNWLGGYSIDEFRKIDLELKATKIDKYNPQVSLF